MEPQIIEEILETEKEPDVTPLEQEQHDREAWELVYEEISFAACMMNTGS